MSNEIVGSELFTYNPVSKTLVTEASYLPALQSFRLPILIRSAKTGNVAGFEYQTTNHDREGDVVSWVYRNTTAGLDLTVIIFND